MSAARTIVLLMFCTVFVHAQEPVKTASVRERGLQKNTALDKRYALLNINNVTAWSRYDGHSAHSPTADDGVYFPRGTGSVIYQDCFLWGGKVFRDQNLSIQPFTHPIRIGGGTYGVGTRAGRIIDPSLGSAVGAGVEDQNAADVRVHRIRRDYATLTYEEIRPDAASVYEIDEADVTGAMISELRAQYQADWITWPVSKGAPFIDRNGNGVYDPPPPFDTDPQDGTLFTIDSLVEHGYDEPGLSGADPAEPAGQVVWTVYNDLNVSASLGFAASYPIGLEVQKTTWAYRGPGSLANAYFIRHRMINKGGVDTSDASGDQFGSFWIDSMFVSQWSDTDLGNAGDDLVGCDTTLEMGYVYNSSGTDYEFASFGLAPPAVGYMLVAGPSAASPGDSALRVEGWMHGRRALQLTSFAYQGPGAPYDDCYGYYMCAAGRYWKVLRGFQFFGLFSTPDTPFPTPPGVPPNPFPLSGDPIFRAGHIDGQGTPYSYFPGDRRIFVNSGPFRLAPGDTQDVIMSFVAGMGADHLTSLAVMKFHAGIVRSIAFNSFRPNLGPAPPRLSAIPLDGEVILRWDSSETAVRRTEQPVISGQYRFEGYNVYELPSSDAQLSEGVRVTTFDIDNGTTRVTDRTIDPISGVPVGYLAQQGTDTGIRRTYRATRSLLTDPMNGTLLSNGTEYHFAVTAYNVSDDPTAIPRTVESVPVIVTVRPQRPFGQQLRTHYGDTLAVRHVSGQSDIATWPVVVDPTRGTGDTYRLSFTGDPAGSWSLFNVSQSRIVVSGVQLQYNETLALSEGGVTLRFDSTSTSSRLSDADSLEFTIATPGTGSEVVTASLKRIGVYPNPYMAERLQATRSRPQFVTFTNLPARAVIQVFNLAGHLVRTLRKEGPSQFLDWDLLNEYGMYVGSGMYVCRVELPDLNAVRVLKLGVVMSMEEPW